MDNTALMKICQDFIEKHKISCSETIYQTDRVIEDSYSFIDDICNIVGFYQEKDD